MVSRNLAESEGSARIGAFGGQAAQRAARERSAARKAREAEKRRFARAAAQAAAERKAREVAAEKDREAAQRKERMARQDAAKKAIAAVPKVRIVKPPVRKPTGGPPKPEKPVKPPPVKPEAPGVRPSQRLSQTQIRAIGSQIVSAQEAVPASARGETASRIRALAAGEAVRRGAQIIREISPEERTRVKNFLRKLSDPTGLQLFEIAERRAARRAGRRIQRSPNKFGRRRRNKFN